MSRVLPILFNTDMVRAILNGRKTVTRRLIKKLPDDAEFSGWLLDSTCQEDAKDIGSAGFKTLKQPTEKAGCVFVKPPYQPGDILYVRETWYEDKYKYMYRADYAEAEKFYRGGVEVKVKWRPSIHMPKEAARIWLKVKDVRVERLQDITEEQAKTEGIRGYSKDGNLYKYAVTDDWWISYHHKYRKFFTGSWWQDMPRTAKEAFHHLWNSTLGKRDTLEWYANNWSGNPWVWVIEFERCEKPENM